MMSSRNGILKWQAAVIFLPIIHLGHPENELVLSPEKSFLDQSTQRILYFIWTTEVQVATLTKVSA